MHARRAYKQGLVFRGVIYRDCLEGGYRHARRAYRQGLALVFRGLIYRLCLEGGHLKCFRASAGIVAVERHGRQKPHPHLLQHTL